jgi:hypothetical protein
VILCLLAPLVASLPTISINLGESKQIELSNPSNPALCGSYTYSISPADSFVALTGSSLKITPF